MVEFFLNCPGKKPSAGLLWERSMPRLGLEDALHWIWASNGQERRLLKFELGRKIQTSTHIYKIIYLATYLVASADQNSLPLFFFFLSLSLPLSPSLSSVFGIGRPGNGKDGPTTKRSLVQKKCGKRKWPKKPGGIIHDPVSWLYSSTFRLYLSNAALSTTELNSSVEDYIILQGWVSSVVSQNLNMGLFPNALS